MFAFAWLGPGWDRARGGWPPKLSKDHCLVWQIFIDNNKANWKRFESDRNSANNFQPKNFAGQKSLWISLLMILSMWIQFELQGPRGPRSLNRIRMLRFGAVFDRSPDHSFRLFVSFRFRLVSSLALQPQGVINNPPTCNNQLVSVTTEKKLVINFSPLRPEKKNKINFFPLRPKKRY